MKIYPKVPRYDHPVVPSDFFDSESLTLTEKVDENSFRFTLYDERYAAQYSEAVIEAATGDGSLVFGTRKKIRGSHRDVLANIDGALYRAVRCLHESVKTAPLRHLHDTFDGPLIIYAENLVYSTLDYGFDTNELPALVGFDILPYANVKTMVPSGSPYEETHEGFLDHETDGRFLSNFALMKLQLMCPLSQHQSPSSLTRLRPNDVHVPHLVAGR